jgi:hypothetical protein
LEESEPKTAGVSTSRLQDSISQEPSLRSQDPNGKESELVASDQETIPSIKEPFAITLHVTEGKAKNKVYENIRQYCRGRKSQSNHICRVLQ